jgi:hypothetical protein
LRSLCAAVFDAKASQWLPSCFGSHGEQVSKGCWTAFASDAGWLLHGHSTACNACCTSAILRLLKLH